MAIDEISGDKNDKAKGCVSNISTAKPGTTLGNGSDKNKTKTYVEVDDDIVFMESNNLTNQLFKIDDDQPKAISPCTSYSSSVLPLVLNKSIDNSDVYPVVKQIKLRQYGRKHKKNPSNPNQNQNMLSQNTSNVKNPSDVKNTSEAKNTSDVKNTFTQKFATVEDKNLNEGLKSLAEISDSTFSSSVTNEIDSSKVEILPLELPSRNRSAAANENDACERKSEERDQMNPVQQETYDIEEKQDEKMTKELRKKRYEEIRAQLKKMFESSIAESEVRPLSGVVKSDNVPVYIGEDGVITIIYKPEKVNIRRIESLGMTLLSRRSSSEEEKKEENKCNENEIYICSKNNEDTIMENQSNPDISKENHLDKIENPDMGDKFIKRRKTSKMKRLKRKYPPLKKVKYKGRMVYKCDKCDFMHPTCISALRRHMLRHLSADATEWFYCDLCGYRAKRKGNLKVHLMLHRNPDELVWYKCEICDKKFKHKNGLKSHEKRHVKREDLEQYMCNICSYKTPFKHTLLRHTLNHEPPDKKPVFKCTQCSYSTTNKYYLTRHRQTHGEPLYKCLVCEYQGKYKVNLESHMKTHYPRDEVIYCDLCDFSTNRKYSLTLHKRRKHKIYTSEVGQLLFCFNCSFQTSFKRCLVKHMSIHSRTPGSGMLKRIKTEPLSD